jgi:hypothetical protein
MMAKALVKKILEKAEFYEWSLQGFGMLRLHMDYGVRLNVWDSRYRVPNVSLMHSHPWNFVSYIVAGELQNIRWVLANHVSTTEFDTPFEHAIIKPGPGGGLRENKGLVVLLQQNGEVYKAGESYCQKFDEIHVSDPLDGTVTVNERERVGEDLAYVYWPKGTEWVSAEPRPAKLHEVRDITENALKKWF